MASTTDVAEAGAVLLSAAVEARPKRRWISPSSLLAPGGLAAA
jgi:hypothetical protein